MSVAVIGSANLDTTLRVPRIPGPGETLLATSIARSPGGKGANQAVGSARSGGASTTFIAALGQDAEGEALHSALREAGVNDSLVRTLVDVPSGSALITVSDDAENAIVVVPGANEHLLDLSASELGAIASADIALASLEIPLATVVAAAKASRRFVLNAAPSAPLPSEIWEHLAVLVVNEHEAVDLTGAQGVEAAVTELSARVPGLVVTLGAAGAIVVESGVRTQVPATAVVAVDTTGAGDCFCGVLAARLARGDDLVTATRWGSAAAALAVQEPGASDAMPSAADVASAMNASPQNGSTS